MGEKEEKKNEVANKPADGGENKAADGGVKAEEAPMTVVLKMDLHCEGCAKKVRRSVTHLEGVEKVKADCTAKKLTVTGNVDPVWLREKVESKTKKKVELLSPQPKKNGGAGGAAADGGDKKADEKSEKKADIQKADEVEKPKEAVVSSVVMKIRLHCDGCANKIKRIILKNIDGVDSVTTSLEKDLVTVTGTMNVNELTTYLKGKLQRSIEVIPPKKADDTQDKKEKEGGTDKKVKNEGGGTGGGSGGGEKNEKESATGGGGGGGEKNEKESGTGGGGGGEKKEKESPGGEKKDTETKVLSLGGEESTGEKGSIVEVNKMEYHSSTYNPETYYAMPMYNQTYDNQGYSAPMYHHHQGYNYNTGHMVQHTQGPPPPPPTYLNMNDNMFSDENPNGCYVM